MSTPPDITFVFCVESGPLELNAIRLVESLRRWGGRFRNARVIGVTPRIGPRPTPATLERFEELEVTYRYAPIAKKHGWFKFLNKPLALVEAETIATTDLIAWLDSDLLFLKEPDELILSPVEDFAACASEKEMGTTGPGDPFESLWQAHCAALGLDIESLPWITTESEKLRIRAYWNGGLFVYRRSKAFAARYLATCMKLMDARFVGRHPDYSIGINEMSAIGLAVHQGQLAWRALPLSHNHFAGTAYWADDAEDVMRDVRILHYHDSMWPWGWDDFLARLGRTHPEVTEWLSGLGPLRNPASVRSRLISRVLRETRSAQEAAYIASCTPV